MTSAPKIFVVDDEQTIARTLAIILRQQGFEASAFFNAEDALAQMQISAPHLVISDVVMGGMSGIDLLLHLRKEYEKVSCILLSGQAQTCELLEAARAQGNDLTVLVKPIHPRELLVHVRSVLQTA